MQADVRYIVMAGDPSFPLMDEKTGETAEFKSYKAAEKAAKKAAEDEPGKVFFVFEMVTEVRVPGGEAEVYRRYPIEHYK